MSHFAMWLMAIVIVIGVQTTAGLSQSANNGGLPDAPGVRTAYVAQQVAKTVALLVAYCLGYLAARP